MKKTIILIILTLCITLPAAPQNGIKKALKEGVEAVKEGVSPLTNLVSTTKKEKKNNIKDLTLKDGTKYTGEARGKKPHGYGKATYPNGDKYEGEWVKG